MATDHNPTIFAFGVERVPYLSASEETNASFENRLRSVWPYLVTIAKRFAYTCPQTTVEDLLNEMAAHLQIRDHKWKPDRGRYITFVRSVSTNYCRSLYNRLTTEQPTLSLSDCSDDSQLEPLQRRDLSNARTALRHALMKLSPKDAYLITRLCGLFGIPTSSATQLALQLNLSAKAITSRKAIILRRLKSVASEQLNAPTRA